MFIYVYIRKYIRAKTWEEQNRLDVRDDLNDADQASIYISFWTEMSMSWLNYYSSKIQ